MKKLGSESLLDAMLLAVGGRLRYEISVMIAAAGPGRITASNLLAVSPKRRCMGVLRSNYSPLLLQCGLELFLHTVYTCWAEIRHHTRNRLVGGTGNGGTGRLVAVAMWLWNSSY